MPSLRISGGNKEVVRLAQDLMSDGQSDAVIACMWKHRHEVDTGGIRVVHLLNEEPVRGSALLQLPKIVLSFLRFLAQVRSGSKRRIELVLGHYSTYLLAWAAPLSPRICFNQDLEWLFVPKGWRRFLLKQAILLTNRRSVVLTTNSFVTESYRSGKVQPFGEASIWAEPRWLTLDVPQIRDIDVLMLLRSSGIKRLDLHLEALSLFRTRTALRVAVITPDTSVAARIELGTATLYVRPSDEEMRALFARSGVFLLLSEVEGFGLPPLEAMGSGCVPVCRDSGGVRCYMCGEFANLLFALDVPVEQIVGAVAGRLQSGQLPSAESAKKAFLIGLQASRAGRADCIRRMQQMISTAAVR